MSMLAYAAPRRDPSCLPRFAYRDPARPAPRRHTVQMSGSCTDGSKLMEILGAKARCSARNAHDDGDGIQLGAAAGGATINMGAVAYTCPVLSPAGLMRGILVNAIGQRFVDESSNHKRIGEQSVLHQGGKIFLLVDSDVYEEPTLRMPIVATGNSPSELEDELGWPAGTLSATLETYNRHATTGSDPLFGKGSEHVRPLDRPPYAVFDCSLDAIPAYHSFTLGGLMTLADGHVLTPAGAIVPGLFAAGRTTSCLSAQSCGSSGLQLGEGTFFGRKAGQAAAATGSLRA